MSKFIAVTPEGIGGYFGIGDSLEDAKRELKSHGGKLSRVAVFQLPEGAVNPWVDGFGNMRWEWTDGFDGDREAQTTLVHKRGVKLVG